MLDCEELFGESSSVAVAIMSMVAYAKHQIFKANLVSQLNAKVSSTIKVANKRCRGRPPNNNISTSQLGVDNGNDLQEKND